MNYYPFHIGDYLSATRHLTWTEDAAYRRLLDTYYTTEKPLPSELRAVCRLVLATTDEQREAVQVVLSEFFELTSAGWINVRADAEIDSMRVKQSAQEDKDRHETERMRRYRERRAQMFAALRAVEVVPAWDVPMKELQRLFDQHCNTPATPTNPPETPPATPPATGLQREQAVSGNEPATAIPTPTPTPTPVLIEPNGSVGSADRLPRCDTQSVVDLYHDTLPELPRVRLMTDGRRKAMSAFWRFVLTSKKSDGSPRATNADEAMKWIGGYFARARDNDFLMGRGHKAPGHEGWQCDFDFLLTEKGKKQVIERTKEAA